MRITEERLQEIETYGVEAIPFKAELSELCKAYSASTKGFSITKNSGEVWLNFSTNTGKHTHLSLGAIAKARGPLVAKILLEWAKEV